MIRKTLLVLAACFLLIGICDSSRSHAQNALLQSKLIGKWTNQNETKGPATINITASDVSFRPPFWERNLGQADEITLGLRLAYLSSYYVAPLLLGSEKALVANLSSYEYDDAAYGATKAGLDRMTWHMAQHFKVYSFKGTGI